MPLYTYLCRSCEESEDHINKYEDRLTEYSCDCGEVRTYILKPCSFIPGGGGHKRRITAPDVGPLSKQSRAYEKKRDDENSHFYQPGTDLAMTSKQRKEYKAKLGQMEQGKTNFTK